jgi:type I restriction enzyme S subunit
VIDLAVSRRLAPRSDGARAPVKIADLVSFQTGFAFESQWYVDDGIRVVRNQNIGHGYINWADTKRVGIERANDYARFALCEGDILLSLDRPIISTGLKIARVTSADLPALLLQRVARPVYRSSELLPDYLYLWFRSSSFIGGLDPGRSNGIPHISIRDVERRSMQLPGLNEQRLIVERTDNLLGVVEQLEHQVANARDLRLMLVDAFPPEPIA